MSRYADIAAAAKTRHLYVSGAAFLEDAAQTVLLLSPEARGFWAAFSASKERTDGQPDPLDRWSRRIIVPLAKAVEAVARFPSDGPPYPPFTEWARRSESVTVSPVGLLVDSESGLWLSFRGALLVQGRLDLPAPSPSPCDT